MMTISPVSPSSAAFTAAPPTWKASRMSIRDARWEARSLHGAKLYGSRLAANLLSQTAGKIVRGACELLVAEGVNEIHTVGELAHITSVRQADAFGDGDHNESLFCQEFLNADKEIVDIEGKFRDIDQVRSIAILALGERRGTNESSGVSAHDLDDGDKALIVDQRLAVLDDLFH